MAQAMTFTSLQEDVKSYLERGFSAGSDPIVYKQIPRLINLAERRLARDLKIQGFQAQVATMLQVGIAVYPKPDRWRDTVSINIGTGPNLNLRNQVYLRSYEYCRTHFPDESYLAEPEFYADYDYDMWLFSPTPDKAYPMEILYYELPELLEDAVQSNWLTEFAPNALLYATLLEASPFLKNDERVPLWQQFYQDSIASLNREDLGKIVNRTAIRQEA